MNEDKQIIRSYKTYVGDKWLVSTEWRSFDTYEGQSWGYETMVWRWDSKTKALGALMAQGGGLNDHFDFCRRLIKGGEEALSHDVD